MLISIVLTVVFTCIALFAAGICLGRWMGQTSRSMSSLEGVAGNAGGGAS